MRCNVSTAMTLVALIALARGLRGFLGLGPPDAAAAALKDDEAVSCLEAFVTLESLRSFGDRFRETVAFRRRGERLLEEPLLDPLDLLLPLDDDDSEPDSEPESLPLPLLLLLLPLLLRLLLRDEPLVPLLSESLPEDDDDDSESLYRCLRLWDDMWDDIRGDESRQ